MHSLSKFQPSSTCRKHTHVVVYSLSWFHCRLPPSTTCHLQPPAHNIPHWTPPPLSWKPERCPLISGKHEPQSLRILRAASTFLRYWISCVAIRELKFWEQIPTMKTNMCLATHCSIWPVSKRCNLNSWLLTFPRSTNPIIWRECLS
jgi:hypothetical protein